MIELAKFADGYPKIMIDPSHIVTVEAASVRPSWTEAGYQSITRITLKSGEKVLVSHEPDWVLSLIEKWKDVRWLETLERQEPEHWDEGRLPAYTRASLHKIAIALAHLWLSAWLAERPSGKVEEFSPMTLKVWPHNMQWGEPLLGRNRCVKITIEVEEIDV